MTEPEIVVVPHTHWDREWYEPHDVFRLRLVEMIDGLLDMLEAEPQMRFTLDGQTAAIEDYLQVRPAARARVERAVAAGQLALGPFLILLDEFCCDGETIVRNLELGTAGARALGASMPVGYLPDMFGHAAQTPQILRGFGIADAVLWRGVPARVDRHAFIWSAPDGSAVRCEYLWDGYGNALDVFALPRQLPELAARYVTETASWFGPDPVLGMLGSDHTSPPSDLMERLRGYDGAATGPVLGVATVAGYLERVRALEASRGAGPAQEVVGELRSHARGNLLPGVFSIRTLLKEAMASAEVALTVAERLDALYPVADHSQALRMAWYRLVESTAHDSVTGCGVDATAEQVGTRIRTAGHVARGVSERVLREVAGKVGADRFVVINPSGYPRAAQAELTLAVGADEVPAGVQVVGSLPQVLGSEVLATADLPRLLRRIHGRELFGQQINRWEIDSDTREIRFDVAEVPVGEFDLAAFTAALGRAQAAAPETSWRVETIAAPRTRVVAALEMAGLEVAVLDPAAARTGSASPVTATAGATGGATASGARGPEAILDNALVRVEFATDGTATIISGDCVLTGVFGLLDEGDRGDSYNYGPVEDAPVTVPAQVSIEVVDAGPLRASVRVTRQLSVPEGIAENDRSRRSDSEVSLAVVMLVEVRAGEPFVRARVSVTNTARDHRLRMLVPTRQREVATSCSAGQFGVTERGREAEGGWGEFPLPTFPAYRWVHAGDATALVRKLTEYEVVTPEVAGGAGGTGSLGELGDSGQDVIALTLLRSVGMMSVNVHPLRDEPAGSEIPVPGAQYLGQTVVTEFAVLPSPEGWQGAEAVRWSDVFRLDPVVVRGGAGFGVAGDPEPPAVRVASQGSLALESLRRVGDEVEARWVNYGAQAVAAPDDSLAAGRPDWRCTDLAGHGVDGDAAAEVGAVEVGPSEILTLRRR